jgi:hypothetical protein
MHSRRNILIIALSVILGLMFITAAVLVYRGFIDLRRVEAEEQGKIGDLERLHKRNPFPSDENCRMEQENLEVLGEELADLLAVMGLGQIESVDQSPPKFMAEFWDARRELKAKAKEAGVALTGGDDCDFGFSRHLAGNLPAPQDVPRLTQQLKITQALCEVLYAARISELRGIGREEFEVEAVSGAGIKPAATGRRRAEAAPTLLNAVSANAGKIAPDQLYGKWHFVLLFTVKESALVGVLNGLARSPIFAVVTRLEIVGDNKLFDRSLVAARASRKGAAEAASKSVEAGKESAVLVPRDQRVACGRETVLTVKMELDVLQFVRKRGTGMDEKAKGAK